MVALDASRKLRVALVTSLWASLRRRWNLLGLAGAASAGRAELDKRGMNALIYESPREGVTVIVAREGRAEQLREAWDRVFKEPANRGGDRMDTWSDVG